MAGYNDPESGYVDGASGFFTILSHMTDITNKFDKDATPSVGDVPTWNGSVYAPAAGGGGSGSSDGTAVNVLDFGVTGNGSTDDTAALQALITSATTGDTIYFPSGTYILDTLTVDSKTGVKFYGPTAVLKRKSSVTNHLFRIGEGGACTNLRFDIGEIDGNNFVGSSTTGSAFDVRNTTGLEINAYIHHTWNHGIRFTTTPSSNVKINLRAEFIGRGYTADATFNPSSPHGCAVYNATAAPLTDADVTVRGTDIKGFGVLYIGGCTRYVARLNVKRTGFRGLYCAGTANVTRLVVVDPVIEDCGAVYERNPADEVANRKGEGSNAIFPADSPVTAQDCVILGGSIKRTGENFVEGICTVIGLVGEEGGYQGAAPYSTFGSDLAREGLNLRSGSKVQGGVLTNPGIYGIRRFSSSTAITDITIVGVEIIGATSKSISIQQSTTGTATRVIANNVICRKGAATPTHSIHFEATSGASFSASVIKGTVTEGTFSTSATPLATVSGGGTNTTTVVADTTSV